MSFLYRETPRAFGPMEKRAQPRTGIVPDKVSHSGSGYSRTVPGARQGPRRAMNVLRDHPRQSQPSFDRARTHMPHRRGEADEWTSAELVVTRLAAGVAQS